MFTNKASRPLTDGTGDAHTWKANHGWLTFETGHTFALVRLTDVFVNKRKKGTGYEDLMLAELLQEMPVDGVVTWPFGTTDQVRWLRTALATLTIRGHQHDPSADTDDRRGKRDG